MIKVSKMARCYCAGSVHYSQILGREMEKSWHLMRGR